VDNTEIPAVNVSPSRVSTKPCGNATALSGSLSCETGSVDVETVGAERFDEGGQDFGPQSIALMPRT
jgi:hypothetical protein